MLKFILLAAALVLTSASGFAQTPPEFVVLLRTDRLVANLFDGGTGEAVTREREGDVSRIVKRIFVRYDVNKTEDVETFQFLVCAGPKSLVCRTVRTIDARQSDAILRNRKEYFDLTGPFDLIAGTADNEFGDTVRDFTRRHTENLKQALNAIKANRPFEPISYRVSTSKIDFFEHYMGSRLVSFFGEPYDPQ